MASRTHSPHSLPSSCWRRAPRDPRPRRRAPPIPAAARPRAPTEQTNCRRGGIKSRQNGGRTPDPLAHRPQYGSLASCAPPHLTPASRVPPPSTRRAARLPIPPASRAPPRSPHQWAVAAPPPPRDHHLLRPMPPLRHRMGPGDGARQIRWLSSSPKLA